MDPHIRQQFGQIPSLMASPPQNIRRPPFFQRGQCPGYFSPRPPGLTPPGTAPGVQGFVGLPDAGSGHWQDHGYMNRPPMMRPPSRFYGPGMTPPRGNFCPPPRYPNTGRFTSPPPGNFNHEQGNWGGNNQGHHNNKRQRQGGEGGQHAPMKKMPKVDKRDLAENNQYFCDCCDRGFKLEKTFIEHQQGHVQCRIDGCSYVAAPKLVKLHVNVQHRTGLAKKIWQLESKEDINKWIAERKRCYPTAENIARKSKLQTERSSRGEVLENKFFGKMRQRGMNRVSGATRAEFDNDIKDGRATNEEFSQKGFRGKNHRRRRRGQRQKKGINDADVNMTDDVSEADGRKLSTELQDTKAPADVNAADIVGNEAGELRKSSTSDPLAYLLDGDTSDSDEPVTVTQLLHSADGNKPLKGGESLQLPGVLNSLVASYGDMSDSEEDSQTKQEDSPTTQDKIATDQINGLTKQDRTSPKQPDDPQKQSASQSSRSVEHRRAELSEKPPEQKSSPKRNKSSPKKSHSPDKQRVNIGTNASKKLTGRQLSDGRGNAGKQKSKNDDLFYRPRPTLLEKLLAPDIRHERNVILQCVYYIVKNKFFGKDQVRPVISPADISIQTSTSARLQEQMTPSCEDMKQTCHSLKKLTSSVSADEITEKDLC